MLFNAAFVATFSTCSGQFQKDAILVHNKLGTESVSVGIVDFANDGTLTDHKLDQVEAIQTGLPLVWMFTYPDLASNFSRETKTSGTSGTSGTKQQQQAGSSAAVLL